MAQEHVNFILNRIMSSNELGNEVHCKITESPEYVQLTPEEKRAFSKVDFEAINEFLLSAEIRRVNSIRNAHEP